MENNQSFHLESVENKLQPFEPQLNPSKKNPFGQYRHPLAFLIQISASIPSRVNKS